MFTRWLLAPLQPMFRWVYRRRLARDPGPACPLKCGGYDVKGGRYFVSWFDGFTFHKRWFPRERRCEYLTFFYSIQLKDDRSGYGLREVTVS